VANPSIIANLPHVPLSAFLVFFVSSMEGIYRVAMDARATKKKEMSGGLTSEAA